MAALSLHPCAAEEVTRVPSLTPFPGGVIDKRILVNKISELSGVIRQLADQCSEACPLTTLRRKITLLEELNKQITLCEPFSLFLVECVHLPQYLKNAWYYVKRSLLAIQANQESHSQDSCIALLRS